MFLSYECIDFLSSTRRYGEPLNRICKYRIVDTDFEDVVRAEYRAGDRSAIGPANAIIKVYSKRCLPVASNLMRWMMSEVKSIEYIVNLNKKINPHWTKYDKDIEKLLLLM